MDRHPLHFQQSQGSLFEKAKEALRKAGYSVERVSDTPPGVRLWWVDFLPELTDRQVIDYAERKGLLGL